MSKSFANIYYYSKYWIKNVLGLIVFSSYDIYYFRHQNE